MRWDIKYPTAVYFLNKPEEEPDMIEVSLYFKLIDEKDEDGDGRLIMHRSYKDSTLEKVSKYMQEYVMQEDMTKNGEGQITIKIQFSNSVEYQKLDLRDYKDA